MNPPQVYICSPSWTLLPPPSPFHPSGSSQCTSPKHPVSCIEPGLATHFMIFYMFQCQGIAFFKVLKMKYSWLSVLCLVPGVQHSDSIIHIYTFFFIFFFIEVYCRILNVVPCAIQLYLVVYPSYVYNSLFLVVPNFQSNPPQELHFNKPLSNSKIGFRLQNNIETD